MEEEENTINWAETKRAEINRTETNKAETNRADTNKCETTKSDLSPTEPTHQPLLCRADPVHTDSRVLASTLSGNRE